MIKYIIFTHGGFALIPDISDHDSVVIDRRSVVSAGYCWIESYRNDNDDTRYRVSCWGESITLKVKSKGPEDAEFIMKHMR